MSEFYTKLKTYVDLLPHQFKSGNAVAPVADSWTQSLPMLPGIAVMGAGRLGDEFSNELASFPQLFIYFAKTESPLSPDDDLVHLTASSGRAANEWNSRALETLDRDFRSTLLESLRAQPLEPGIDSAADRIVLAGISKNRLATLAWLNALFVECFQDPQVASDLLLLISRIPYDVAKPNGPTMAIAGLSHKSPMVKEAGIRAFENWGSEEGLAVLGQTEFSQDWLRDYAEKVMSDLSKH